MARGGYRNGAGRKKGLRNKISAKKVLAKIDSEDCKDPLTIMVDIMNRAYAEDDYRLALEAARGAAPYIHAKLSESKVELNQVKLDKMSDDELNRLIEDGDETVSEEEDT